MQMCEWGGFPNDVIALILSWRAEVDGVGGSFTCDERMLYFEEAVHTVEMENGLSEAGRFVVVMWARSLKNLTYEGGNISREDRLAEIDRVEELLKLEFVES